MSTGAYPAIGTTDPATGRVAVSVAGFASSPLNGEAYAYLHVGATWRTVDSVDAKPGGFDLCLADGAVRPAGPLATFYVEPGVASRLAA